METDYLIIGQGICGTLVSYLLKKAGKRVLVIDDHDISASSRVASDLINPVTGQRIVQSWMIPELLPVAIETYHSIEKELSINILEEMPLLDFHPTEEEKNIFTKRVSEDNAFLHQDAEQEKEQQSYFRFNYGVGVISPCLLVNLPVLLTEWRTQLSQAKSLITEKYDQEQLTFLTEGIRYKDILAQAIIYCGGVHDFADPMFSALPWSRNKGEALIAAIPGLPGKYIYKQGIKIVPFGKDLFWIGASFDWKYQDTLPTTAYRQKVEDQLKYWLKLPYTITDHWASERPGTVDYKPFVGEHPVHKRVYMLNGMGSKACSQAPYFAIQLANHLLQGTPILPQAALERYKRILGRTN